MATFSNFIIYFCLVVGIVNCSVFPKYKFYADYKAYEIRGNALKLHDLAESLRDVKNEEIITTLMKSRLDVLIPPDFHETFRESLKESQLNYTLLYDDYSRLITPPFLRSKSDEFTWTDYYDINDINNYLNNVSKANPSIAKLIVGGKSYEGRDIVGLNINNNKNDGKEKPAIFIESGIHAREWIAPATITYFINELMNSKDPDIIALRDNIDWHIFPVVNPDGYHYTFTYDRMWRKTRSKSNLLCYGTDANRNWDHNWGKHGSSNNPCDYQTFAGAKPFSEPETQSLSEYISGVDNLVAYLGFHADAQMLLVPYSDSTDHVDNYDDLIKIGKTSLEYGKRVNGVEYDGPATAAEILYKASGGSMDWVRQALETPLVYTYELRGQAFQWPKERISEQGDEVTQMILGLVTEARNLNYIEFDSEENE